MADGISQRGFGFRAPGRSLLRPDEIVVDLFAGGGGASEALRQALGRDPDICINHDPWAIGMHAANHPFARHLCEDVWHADPRRECAGRPVGWLHASPDCTHFSQAKGGQPRSRATRSLSWVVLKWAGSVRPRIISLENVEQILKWAPLVAKRDRMTGRAVRLDGTVAAPGERVSIGEQFLAPDKRHEGRTWCAFVAALRALDYAVEWRMLRACDYGAGTSRRRLFLIARSDGEPIRWPEPTHGPGRAQPFVTAADCIDWSIPCPSIFERKRPLADATLRRIARGIKRYLLGAVEPYIVTTTAHGYGLPGDVGEQHTARPGGLENRARATRAPSEMPGSKPPSPPTSPFLTEFANTSRGATWSADEPRRGSGAHDVEQPLGTVHARGGSFALVSAFLEQANGGGPNGKPARARGCNEPVSAITGTGSQQRLVTANMVTMRGDNIGAAASYPLRVISAGGEHHAIVECTLSSEHEAGALRVAAFMIRYYGEGGQWGDCRDPLDTITTRDRLALVTVTVSGVPYVIIDIGLRMLRPPELYLAQGFPTDYVIDRTADFRPINGTRAVRMVGNSVSPPPLVAIARANLDEPLVEAA
jgi:DNA (cytosine-5)-methyltransferase 1